MLIWLQNNWLTVVAAVWSLDQLLKIVAKLTPTKIDDNVADYLGTMLAKFFPKGQ